MPRMLTQVASWTLTWGTDRDCLRQFRLRKVRQRRPWKWKRSRHLRAPQQRRLRAPKRSARSQTRQKNRTTANVARTRKWGAMGRRGRWRKGCAKDVPATVVRVRRQDVGARVHQSLTGLLAIRARGKERKKGKKKEKTRGGAGLNVRIAGS